MNYMNFLKNIFIKVDSILVPPHEFVHASSIQRLTNQYLPNLFIKKKLNYSIIIFWYLITLSASPIAIIFYLIIRNFYNFKILKIDLSQIGSILWLATVSGHYKLCDKNLKLIVGIPNIPNKQNKYIYSYLDSEKFGNFKFIKNILLRFLISSISWWRFATVTTEKFECYKDNIYSEYAEFIRNSLSTKQYKLKDIDFESKIKNNFFKDIKPKGLVTINLRTSNFYKETFNSIRNVNSEDYFRICELLNDLQYSICFTNPPGDLLEQRLIKANISYKIYDKTSNKGQLENLLALTSCKYFIGSSTGASVIPLMSNIPVFWTNMYLPIWVPLKNNDLVLYKNYIDKNNNKISFDQFIEVGLGEPDVMNYAGLKRKGIKVEFNTEDELFLGFQIFLKMQNNIKSNGINLKENLKSIKDSPFHSKIRWSKGSESYYLDF